MADTLYHLTLDTGHARHSPRHEVTDDVIQVIQRAITSASAPPSHKNTVFGMRLAHFDLDEFQVKLTRFEGRTRSLYTLCWQGIPTVVCILTVSKSEVAEDWAAMGMGRQRPVMPLLAIKLLPGVLQIPPEIVLMLGDLERCVAWAIIEESRQPHPAFRED
jgi:hypothetical protein